MDMLPDFQSQEDEQEDADAATVIVPRPYMASNLKAVVLISRLTVRI